MASNLTKSKFKLALECPTKLYYIDKPEYANQQTEDSFLKALAEGGYQVEALARCYFPDGIAVQADNNQSAILTTQNLLSKDSITLFEAAIKHNRYFIRTDILIKNGNHLKLIEVKAKSINKNSLDKIEKRDGTINSEWKPYIADVAFQKWVLKQVYPNHYISSYLMLIDKDSICPTDGLNQKFLLEKDKTGRPIVTLLEPLTKEDLSVRLLQEINVDTFIEKIWTERDKNGITFKERFQKFSQLYFNNEKVKPIPKKECATCQFKTSPDDESKGYLSGFKECWQESLHFKPADFNDSTVLDLWNYRKKDQCLNLGLIKLKDFDENDISIKSDDKPGISGSQRQWLQIEKVKHKDNSVWIDKQGLSDEVQSWNYPLHFIDFETAMLPIPLTKGTHPYQGIAFQFSHHTIDANGNVKHAGDYLNTDTSIDNSVDFIRALKSQLESDSGTIFRYSNHENTYLNLLLKQLNDLPKPPEDKDTLINFIKSITKSPNDSREKWVGERCMVDLWDLVKRYYYDPVTNGSNSIKKIFPAILNRSNFLQEKYSHPIYGAKDKIHSNNFSNFQWIIIEQDTIKDPYSLLEPINKEAPNEKIEMLFEDEHLKEGGAATIAYAKLQYTHMSDFEREQLIKALLRYCELDTLAMVMIVEAWLDMLK